MTETAKQLFNLESQKQIETSRKTPRFQQGHGNSFHVLQRGNNEDRFFFPVSSGTLISVAVGTDPEKANAD